MIQILYVYSDTAILILRLTLAFILLAHGWPKIRDLKTNAQNFDGMGFRPGRFWGTAVAVAEFVGGLFLLAGMFTQIAALILAIEFIVIVLWRIRGKQKLVSGYELDLVILGALLILATTGSSLYALDTSFSVFFF